MLSSWNGSSLKSHDVVHKNVFREHSNIAFKFYWESTPPLSKAQCHKSVHGAYGCIKTKNCSDFSKKTFQTFGN